MRGEGRAALLCNGCQGRAGSLLHVLVVVQHPLQDTLHHPSFLISKLGIWPLVPLVKGYILQIIQQVPCQ